MRRLENLVLTIFFAFLIGFCLNSHAYYYQPPTPPDGGSTTYTVGDTADWEVDPSTVGDALDTLAANGIAAKQAANAVMAGPTTGADALAAFRALVVADIPNLTLAKLPGGGSLDDGGILFINGTDIDTDSNATYSKTNGQFRIDTPAGAEPAVYVDKVFTDPVNSGSLFLLNNTTTLTASSFSSYQNVYSILSPSIGSGQSAFGSLTNYYSLINRGASGDEGTAADIYSYASKFTSGFIAVNTGAYVSFEAGGHETFAGVVTDMFDFRSKPSTLSGGTVTNRYGIYLDADSGFTKKNWLSGLTKIGGSSYALPAEALVVDGNAVVSGTLNVGSVPFEAYFQRTATIASANADTAVVLLNTADVPASKKVYLSGFRAKVNGATAWTTTTECRIEDTTGTDYITLPVALLTGNATLDEGTATVVWADAFALNTAGVAGDGLQIICDADGATGSDLVLTVFGVIK